MKDIVAYLDIVGMIRHMVGYKKKLKRQNIEKEYYLIKFLIC